MFGYRAIILILLVMMLSGCHLKLVKPAADSVPMKETRDLSALKFSYAVLNLEDFIRADAEQALLAVFAAKRIKDVIKSEKFEQGRLNVIVYLLQSRQATLSRYVDLPLGIISLGTLFLVPYFAETVHPVEIHVIDPDREPEKQLKIIRTEYEVRVVSWLPYVFKTGSRTATGEDEAYSFMTGGKAAVNLENAGLRRILEQAIEQAAEQ
jgi:hypothetical protein